MENVVLMRRPKLLIPADTILKPVLTQCQGSFGIAAAFEDTIDIQGGTLDFKTGGVDTQVNSINEFQKTYLDAAMILQFTSATLSKESTPPFPIMQNGDEHLLVAFLGAGDYSKHAEPRSLHSDAFFAMAKFLRPKLVEFAEAAGGDIPKFVEVVDENGELISSNLFGETGSVCIMTFDGKILMFTGEKSPGVETEWGWMSYDVTAPVQVIAPSARKPRLLLATTNTPAPAAAAEPVVVKTAEEINKDMGDKHIKLVQARPKRSLPPGLQKHAYESYNIVRAKSGRGVIPNKWKDGEVIDVHPKFISTKDFINSMDLVVETKTKLLTSTTPAPASADTKSEDVGMIVVTKKQTEELLTGWEKQGFINAAGLRSADDIQKDETNAQKFKDVSSVSLNDLKRHTDASLLFLINKHPECALIALREALRHVPAAAASQPQQSPVADSASSPAEKPKARRLLQVR